MTDEPTEDLTEAALERMMEKILASGSVISFRPNAIQYVFVEGETIRWSLIEDEDFWVNDWKPEDQA